MTNADAVKEVEDVVNDNGMSVYQVNRITPTSLKKDDIPHIASGEYMVVDVSIAVPLPAN